MPKRQYSSASSSSSSSSSSASNQANTPSLMSLEVKLEAVRIRKQKLETVLTSEVTQLRKKKADLERELSVVRTEMLELGKKLSIEGPSSIRLKCSEEDLAFESTHPDIAEIYSLQRDIKYLDSSIKKFRNICDERKLELAEQEKERERLTKELSTATNEVNQLEAAVYRLFGSSASSSSSGSAPSSSSSSHQSAPRGN